MGDQIRDALDGTLAYAPQVLMERVRTLGAASPLERVGLFADLCRLNALYMIARAGSGHIGSSFSSIDIVSWLLLEEMAPDDLYFSSKGHDAPALYAALIGLGRLPEAGLHLLRRLGGLPGHPDVGTPGIVTNSGSLGMGISKAKGMVLAHRMLGEERRVFVLTGDGELQEGQIWESLAGAVAHRMSELTVIVDHNKLQSDTFVSATSDLGDLRKKLESFGWHVARVDGHDLAALGSVLRDLRSVDGPKVVIADTIKGRGVSFMEHTALQTFDALYGFHSGAPSADQYQRAATELIARIGRGLQALRLDDVTLASSPPRAKATLTGVPQRLIPAYGNALLAHARRDPRVVALDADLMVDMGLLPLKYALPKRVIECGIAEMDMVSMAGGLALRGMRPVCHSFACFLAPRPNEQIYTNATERTRIVYVGGLAGLLPGGPGHSHQAVRDISALGAMPGLEMIAPSNEVDVGAALAYALERARDSTYLRLCSVPWALPFTPRATRLEPGRGTVVRDGVDATIIAYGPVMLSQAYLAAEQLQRSSGLRLQVVDLPWLNRFDLRWLEQVLGERKHLFTIDDHYLDGGQGERIGAALLEAGTRVKLRRFGVQGIPACGDHDEVLRHHGLDAASLAEAIRRELGAAQPARTALEQARS